VPVPDELSSTRRHFLAITEAQQYPLYMRSVHVKIRESLSRECLLMGLMAFSLFVGGSQTLRGDDTGDATANGKGRTHVLLAVGDIMLSGSAAPFLKTRGYDHPFKDRSLQRLITSSDVSFANLEYPVTRSGVRFVTKTYTYRGEPGSLDAIQRAGFNLLSLANNHIMDYGDQGLMATIRGCRQKKMVYAGAGSNLGFAGKLRKIEKRGVHYGPLAYSHTFPEEFWAKPDSSGTAHLDRESLRQDIMRARGEVDILLVSFHWGEELKTAPKPYQVDLAHLAVGAGADVVLGHHPHVPQPIEIYRGKPIFYSLGNYAFGTFSDDVSFSFVAEVLFQGNTPVRVNVYPINVCNREVMFRPRLATGKLAQNIVAHLQGISEPFGTRIGFQKGVGRIFIDHDRDEPLGGSSNDGAP